MIARSSTLRSWGVIGIAATMSLADVVGTMTVGSDMYLASLLPAALLVELTFLLVSSKRVGIANLASFIFVGSAILFGPMIVLQLAISSNLAPLPLYGLVMGVALVRVSATVYAMIRVSQTIESKSGDGSTTETPERRRTGG